MHGAKTAYEIDPPGSSPIGSRGFSVAQTQRILGFGQYRFVDQNTQWTQKLGVSGATSTYNLKLHNGEIIVISSTSTTDKKAWRFDKYSINLQGTNGTHSQVTLDTGVTIPSDFIAYDQHPQFLLLSNDDVLVSSQYINHDQGNNNSGLFVITFNDDYTKVTNIRKLSAGSLTAVTRYSSTTYLDHSRIRYIQGQNSIYFIEIYTRLSSNNYWDPGNSFIRISFGKLSIGQTTSNINRLIYSPTLYGYGSTSEVYRGMLGMMVLIFLILIQVDVMRVI